MSAEIRRSLVVSTAHIPHVLAEAMNMVGIDEAIQRSRAHDERVPPYYATAAQRQMLSAVSFESVNFGYQLWVPEATDDNYTFGPQQLCPLYDYARAQGCTYIVLDCDADTLDNLPKWEW